MKKILAAFLLTLVLLPAGCSRSDNMEHHYLFLGESESWVGMFTADSIEYFYKEDGTLCYDIWEKTQFSAVYKGELSELSSVKTIEISYEMPAGGGSKSISYAENESPDEKVFSSGRNSYSSGGALVQENDVIQMTVDIDGKTETMELKVNPLIQIMYVPRRIIQKPHWIIDRYHILTAV